MVGHRRIPSASRESRSNEQADRRRDRRQNDSQGECLPEAQPKLRGERQWEEKREADGHEQERFPGEARDGQEVVIA